MHHRRHDTRPAYENTCTWILKHMSYCKWVSEGWLLWIKGKPGAGKTTLMEFLLRDSEQASYKGLVNIAFFLHGRGTSLQKTPLGLFRSLLHQLFTQVPSVSEDFRSTFEEKCKTLGEVGRDWDWHVNELRNFFFLA